MHAVCMPYLETVQVLEGERVCMHAVCMPYLETVLVLEGERDRCDVEAR